MSKPTVTITCACCQRRGLHHARGLTEECYPRHRAGRTLHRFPAAVRPAETPWTPSGPHGERMLARYADLAVRRLSPARIAFELGVGERTVQRYAAAYALQQAEQAQGVAA